MPFVLRKLGCCVPSRLKIKNANVFKVFRHPKINAISCAPAASRVLSVCAHFSNCG